MIRPLRRLHYQAFMVLGWALPVVFAFGLVARKPFPTLDTLPAALATSGPRFPICLLERGDLFAKSPIQVRLLRETSAHGALAVGFAVDPGYVIKPDLMVYWLAGNPAVAEQLPEGARWLGEFNADALPLPVEASATKGVLVLYSLANHEIVEVSQPMTFSPPPP